MPTVTLTRANFDDVVLRASQPVLVDFWAPWCGPCRALAPILDKLALEFGGRFTLAKLNTDDEPELASRYRIRGIPHCKLFIDGEIAEEFTGALPERAVREFLLQTLPSPAASLVSEARALLAANDAAGALARLDAAGSADHDEDVALTRSEALLALDRAADADAAIRSFEQTVPERGLAVRDERRLAALKARIELASGAEDDVAALAQKADATPVDCDAKLAYARALAARGDYPFALEQLLAIVRSDRQFGDDIARRTMLTIFEALPPDSDVVRRYRRELASALN